MFVNPPSGQVGRSHKDDRSDSGNCFFDCKVLSRAHAKILFEDGKFYLVDTGSSNGSFVNNIRLSKCGEESKVTEIFSGDSLRFGSDVVDKSKNVTQKCIVAKVQLFVVIQHLMGDITNSMGSVVDYSILGK